jgi:hypothetical protein
MAFLNKLERWFGPFAIPNVSLWIVAGQFLVLMLALTGKVDLSRFLLVPDLVRAGEWWRVIAFVFLPPPPGMFGYLLIAFAWYLFYLMGSALEGYWGVFRYNLFLFIGYALTVGVAFFTPQSAATNAFIAGSVFLAFAYLNPDFELMLFFILPVKIKWLALLTWIGYAVTCFIGDWPTRFMVFASVGNFLLFFGRDLVQTMGLRRRRMQTQAAKFARAAGEAEPRHRCFICGKTDLTDPQLDFRYCSKCAGDQCYCPSHIHDHTHVVAGKSEK